MQTPIAVGETIAGKYLVERVLGQGGMGIVVAARHIELDERVAVKFVHAEYAQNAEAVARFQREARAAVKIRSEHVARVMDVGRLENGAPYMVMEYLDGCDLGELVARRGPLPIDEAVLYILQACEALAEAHANGIIHRDIKPANLFLVQRADGSPCVKLLDFGISKLTGASTGPTSGLIATQGMIGSPLYMSPEQLQSAKDIDARTDVWSLGVILYELLTATQPFFAETLPQLIVQILNTPPRPIAQFRPGLPKPLEDALDRALCKAREERFTDVATFAAALHEFAPHGRLSVERAASILRLGASRREARVEPTPAPTAQKDPTLSPWGATHAPKASRGRIALVIVPIVVLAAAGVFAALRIFGSTPPPPTTASAPTAIATVAEAPSVSASPEVSAAPVAVPSTTASTQAPVASTKVPKAAVPKATAKPPKPVEDPFGGAR